MRKLTAVLRFFYFAIIAALLLCSLLFGLMQTKWAKEQVAKYIAQCYAQSGLRVKIEHLEGRLPFTWHIDHIYLEWGVAESLELSNVKVRIAILPLLKKTFSIDYLNVEQAHFAFSRSQSQPFDVESLFFPFRIIVQRLKIDSLRCENLSLKKTAVYFVVAGANLGKQIRDFYADISLFPRGFADNAVHVTASGDKKTNALSLECKAHLSSMRPLSVFYPIPFDSALDLSFSVFGRWSEWHALWNKETVSSPFIGQCQLEIQPLNTHSLFDRLWSINAQFSTPTFHSLFLNPFTVKSDLCSAVVQGEIDKDLEKSSGRISLHLPELSLFDAKMIRGLATLEATYTRGHTIADVEGHHLSTYALALEQLSGHIEGDYAEDTWEGAGHFHTGGGLPLESSFDFAWQPLYAMALYNLSVTGPSLFISGDINADFKRALFTGDLYAHVEKLTPFISFFPNSGPLDGKLAIECGLSEIQEKQAMRLTLLGENCSLGATHIQHVNCYADLSDLLHNPLGTFSCSCTNVETPTATIASLDFETSSDEEGWPFSVQCKGDAPTPFLFAATGLWKNEKTLFELEMHTLSGQLFSYPFSLHYPFTFEKTERSCWLSPVHMTIGDGSLFAKTSLSEVRSTAELKLEHIPLKLLDFLPLNRDFSGTFSCNGFVDALPGNIQGALHANLEEVRFLHFDKKQPLEVKGSIQAHIENSIVQTHAYIRATKEQFVDFSATLPLRCTLYPFALSIDKERPLSSELIAQGRVEDLFDFFQLGIHQATGYISSHLFLSQTFNSPSLQGNIEWQEGTYENYLTGTSLREIQAELLAAKDQIHLTAFSAKDDKKGTATGEGKIALDPRAHFPYAFIAELKQLNTVNFNPIDCALTGPLYIHGTTKEAFAQGNLIVPQAEFRIPETLPLQIPVLPVTFVNATHWPAPSALSRRPAFPFHINLELTAEQNVQVKGRGLQSEWGGTLHLSGTNMHVIASGTLQLIKGEYSLLGKTFKLTEGQILFNDKSTPSATINLSGTLSLAETTITAYLRGPLSSPILTFQSNPQMSTSAILARMLFNKDISDISQPEAIQLATTLISLSGGAGPSVLEAIRKNLRVDRLTIASQTSNPDEIAVQIGKYLTKGVMITLSQSATSSQVIVEVEFRHGFVFQAETQEEQEGKFSLKWTHSY